MYIAVMSYGNLYRGAAGNQLTMSDITQVSLNNMDRWFHRT